MNAIEFFSNIENITCNTLHLLDTSTEKQFPPHKRLPEAIRLYIMKTIQNSIKFSYNITIKCSTKEIELCDICPRQHFAATYKGNNEVNIWDLTTGNLFHTIQNAGNVGAIAFNPDNDYLFIGENTHRQITAWSLNSKQKVYEFNSCKSDKYNIEHIELYKIKSNLVLMSVFMKSKDYDATILNQWTITPQEYSYAGEISQICRHYEAPTKIVKGCYQVKNPKHWSTSILNIEKHNCPTFNLCQQAIKSIASDEDVAKIKAYPEYKTLTILAKNILEHDIQERRKKL